MYLLFIIIVSFLHSISENIAHDFASTRYAGKNPAFWNPEISRNSARKFLGIRWDALSLCNIAIFVTGVLGIVFSQVKFFQISRGFINLFWQIVIALTLYILTYNISTIHYVRHKRTTTSSGN